MKLLAAPIATLAVVVCWFSAACSRPEEDKGDAQSSPPEQRRASPSVDPWKVAADWPVPRGPVGDAQRFLLNAASYQCTDEDEDPNTHQKSHGTIRVVRNEAAAMESIGPYGKNGIITDGKREFVFFQGRYEEEHGDCAAALMGQLRQSSLQSLLDRSEAHTPFLKSEKVDGTEAELYALTARQGDSNPPRWAVQGGHLWVWIAKDDHRPLKVEWKENYRYGSNQDKIEIRTRTVRYAYDPNVKVTLPGP